MHHLAVMYHYVQPKGSSGIVPVEPEEFEAQIDRLSKHYEIVSPDMLTKPAASKPYCVITFDDATKDQYQHAFRILKRKGVPAYFTLMSGPLSSGKIPIMHLVHSVLSYFSDREIWADLTGIYGLEQLSSIIGSFYSYELDPLRRYNKYALNFMLSEAQSRAYLEYKLSSIMELDEFIDEYYISLEEWRDIVDAGMTVGVHAVEHKKFQGEAKEFFEQEIAPCRDYIRNRLGIDPKWYTPAFGGGPAYKEMMRSLQPILMEEGFRGGFTTQPGEIDSTNQFWFNRIDCMNLKTMYLENVRA